MHVVVREPRGRAPRGRLRR